MGDWFQLVGDKHGVQLFGIHLVGVNAENGKKFALSIAVFFVAFLVSKLTRVIIRKALGARYERAGFWARQGVSVFMAVALTITLLSIWFDDPTRLTTALGLVAAGVTFALQRVITAMAGYIVLLRGNTFSVGDRITMGGVRGDVIALGFMQTTIMEMGQPPAVQSSEPAMWVRSRQYTGRIVTVTNDKIFDEPVYNYTRDFDYIWKRSSSASASAISTRRRNRSCSTRRGSTQSISRRWRSPICGGSRRFTTCRAAILTRASSSGSPTTGSR